MATYFHGNSEIQADGLQTLYLMNPSFVGGAYSETQPPSNMLFLNSHVPPSQTQHFVGVPMPTTPTTVGSASSDDPSRQAMHQRPEIPAFTGIPHRFHYNVWDQTAVGCHANYPTPPVTVNSCSDVETSFRRPPTQQGLSLSLSSEQQPAGYRNPVTVISPRGGEGLSTVSGVSNNGSAVFGSKYLKVAQELLDEVVSVGDELMVDKGKEVKEKEKVNDKEAMSVRFGDGSSGSKPRSELTTAEKQELQMRKAKLVSMLDEVEQKYKQYYRQMQIVVTSFEQAAGLGAAKSYTALALQTISKQFRCLKDAISAQIKATSKSLGEEDYFAGKFEGSRLKYVDHQLRQQRALQQLGMIQPNAWRPQRGLPERAVSVLRAWLFEHFLHPYPKDSDKVMLAKQTGLTRSQVSNWFINARVRLWKPMVEEMYMEEFKQQEQNGSGKSEAKKESDRNSIPPQQNNNIQLEQIQTNDSKQEQTNHHNTEISTSTLTRSPTGLSNIQSRPPFSLNVTPKRPRNEIQNSPSSILSVDMDTKHHQTNKEINERFSSELITGTSSGFGGAYQMGGLGRFSPEQLATGFHGNGSVSLSLGLPHCENNLSLPANQQNYLSNQTIQFESRHDQGEMGNHHYNGINFLQQPSHNSNPSYEDMNMQNKKRFAAQLLQNFVT